MGTTWPRMTLAAGPVEVPDRTRREMARPVLYHYDPAFKEVFAHTCELLKRVYRTEHDAVILQGEAILGLEAAAHVRNLVDWIEGNLSRVVKARTQVAGRKTALPASA